MFDMYLSDYSVSGEISAFVVLMRARIIIIIGFNDTSRAFLAFESVAALFMPLKNLAAFSIFHPTS